MTASPDRAALHAARRPGAGRHIEVLDGVRGMAALLVVFTHVGTTLQPPWQHSIDLLARKLFGSMWLGVDLFFVLSGFLITGILLDSRGSDNYFRAFYVRRALRIFPLYYLVLLLLLVVLPAAGVVVPAARDFAQQGWYWSYLSNVRMALDNFMSYSMGYMWSLAVEEQFYLIWPLVVLLLAPKALSRLCAWVVVGVFVARFFLAAAGMTWVQAYVTTLTRVDALAMGAWLAVGARQPGGLATLRPRARRVAVLAGALVVLGMIYKPLLGLALGVGAMGVNYTDLPGDVYVQMARFSFNTVFFGALLVLVLCAEPRTMLARFFGSRVMRTFGKYSYAIYLFHVPLYVIAEHAGLAGEWMPRVAGYQLPRAIAGYCLLVIAATALAWVSWNLYEKHFLKLKERFAYRAPRGRTTEEAIDREREVFASP